MKRKGMLVKKNNDKFVTKVGLVWCALGDLGLPLQSPMKEACKPN